MARLRTPPAAQPHARHKPLVSILTPSFNQAQWLPDALASVACQDYPHIEHIVMDGGSSDGSIEILRDAGDAVQWRSEPDEGQSDAINKAFSISRGEIIGWVNSDDALMDCRVVSDVVALFARRPDVDVVYGHAMRTTADGHFSWILWSPRFDLRTFKRTINYIVQPAAFIRRSALRSPMLDPTLHFAMDYELWLRLAQNHRFERIDRVLAVDRHQPERKTETLLEVFQADLQRLTSLYGLAEPPLWPLYRSWYHVRQRLGGALLIPRLPTDVAFRCPEDARSGLLRRQILSRKSRWPEEFK